VNAVNIHEAKTHLSRLVARVEKGEVITLARDGRPIAKIVPLGAVKGRRSPGTGKGLITISPKFDAPLPRNLQKYFE
jgi:prevent-host-death family protein